MKFKFLMLAFSALFFVACGDANKADTDKDNKKEETNPEEKASAGQKTVETLFNEMIAANNQKFDYKIIEKDFDNNSMRISFEDVTAHVVFWRIDAETVLFGQHTFHKNFGIFPIFFKFDGKSISKIMLEEVVNDGENFVKYAASSSKANQGSKNCCSIYGFLPETKEGPIEVVSTSKTPEELKGRPTDVDKLGTLEFANGKFTFKKL